MKGEETVAAATVGGSWLHGEGLGFRLQPVRAQYFYLPGYSLVFFSRDCSCGGLQEKREGQSRGDFN